LTYVGYMLLDYAQRFIYIYMWVFILDAVLSWFLPNTHIIRRITIFLTEPIVSIFRPLSMRILSRSMIPISLAHLFAYFSLMLLRFALGMVITWLYF